MDLSDASIQVREEKGKSKVKRNVRFRNNVEVRYFKNQNIIKPDCEFIFLNDSLKQIEEQELKELDLIQKSLAKSDHETYLNSEEDFQVEDNAIIRELSQNVHSPPKKDSETRTI